jgi:hypothetical protein
LIESRAGFDQPTDCSKRISFSRTYLWSSWFEGTRLLRVLSITGPSARILQTVRHGPGPSALVRRTVRDAQHRLLLLPLGMRLSPSAGGRDGHLKSLPSIRSLLGHHFSARILMIPIGLSCVAGLSLCLWLYRLCLAESGPFCPRSRSCSLERALCLPAFPEISIVLR